MLFNLYLEEALGETSKLREMVSRGDLLAFADDMLILTNSKAEMTKAIMELEGLNGVWNLRLNKAKSQVLTEDPIQDIAGIPCATQVKYLGVPICLDPKVQREQCLACIKRNLGLMKWKLRKVDIDIKETLTCVLARSIFHLHRHTHGGSGYLEEGRHRPHRGAAVQVHQQPAQPGQQQSPDENGVWIEERLGHCGAPGTLCQPAVEEADQT